LIKKRAAYCVTFSVLAQAFVQAAFSSGVQFIFWLFDLETDLTASALGFVEAEAVPCSSAFILAQQVAEGVQAAFFSAFVLLVVDAVGSVCALAAKANAAKAAIKNIFFMLKNILEMTKLSLPNKTLDEQR
jgi:hypothetical protein